MPRVLVTKFRAGYWDCSGRVGLEILARACVAPQHAVQVWRKMEAKHKAHPKLHPLLSTHPTDGERLEYMAYMAEEKTDAFCRYCPHDAVAKQIIARAAKGKAIEGAEAAPLHV